MGERQREVGQVREPRGGEDGVELFTQIREVGICGFGEGFERDYGEGGECGGHLEQQYNLSSLEIIESRKKEEQTTLYIPSSLSPPRSTTSSIASSVPP